MKHIGKLIVNKIPLSLEYKLPLFILFILELGLLTFWRKLFGPHLSPLLLFLCSLLIAIYPIYIYWKNKVRYIVINDENKKTVRNKLFSILALLIGILTSWVLFSTIISDKDIVAKNSDVIPTIQTLADRLIEGKKIYDPVEYENYEVNSGYLTFHWLPFIIPQYFNFDPRSFAFLILYLSILPMIYITYKTSSSNYEITIKTLLPFLLLVTLIQTNPQIFTLTVEYLFAAYYIILIAALYSKNLWLIVGSLLLCLLSRYTVVIWLPLFFVILYFNRGLKPPILIITSLIVGVLIFYIIPFIVQDPDILTNHFNKASGEWYPESWQSDDAKPFHLFKGVGFASYFYDFAPGEVEKRLQLNQQFHKVISILSVIITIFLYIKYRQKLPALHITSILGLKFIFTFFYSFIHIPYIYLNIVPLFISLCIVIIINPMPLNSQSTQPNSLPP